MNWAEKLLAIQNELKVPKNQKNTFGNYNYRSCEDILEEVKPLCVKYKCVIYFNDEITEVGGRNYVKTTVDFLDLESENESFGRKITAYAREEETKKGMDGSQITGAASSYARKYALNGLFAIDDAKDSDSTNKHEKAPQSTDDDPLGTRPDCSICGKPITGAVATFSIHKFGKALCQDCQKKESK